MLVSLDQVPNILMKYVDRELKPKVQNQGSLLAFGVGAAKYLLPVFIQERLTVYTPLMKTMGLITKDDLLDIDKLEEAAKSGLETSGKLNILGYNFDEADIASIKRIASEHAYG